MGFNIIQNCKCWYVDCICIVGFAMWSIANDYKSLLKGVTLKLSGGL